MCTYSQAEGTVCEADVSPSCRLWAQGWGAALEEGLLWSHPGHQDEQEGRYLSSAFTKSKWLWLFYCWFVFTNATSPVHCSTSTVAAPWSAPTAHTWSLAWVSISTCYSTSSHITSWSFRTASIGPMLRTHWLVVDYLVTKSIILTNLVLDCLRWKLDAKSWSAGLWWRRNTLITTYWYQRKQYFTSSYKL